MKHLSSFRKTLIGLLAIFLFQTLSAVYTLTDGDVEVSSGTITYCTYDFSDTEIIIPSTLDGQTITAIGSDADTYVFSNRGITSVDLPSTIESIGYHAFSSNPLSSVNFTACTALQAIGERAFQSTQLGAIDLSSCAALQFIDDEAFKGANLTSVNFSGCSFLSAIEFEAFCNNLITTVNFSGCTMLSFIGPRAFSGCELGSVDLSGCSALMVIENNAFATNNITSVNLSGCSSLISICRSAFAVNEISSIDFTGCTTLNTISYGAFRINNLSSVDLSPCTALSLIEYEAFFLNSLSNFDLPTNSSYSGSGWMDEEGTTYTGGTNVSGLQLTYYVPQPYTLTDADVVVVAGIIEEFIYDLKLKCIVIPEVLDGQTVIGIADQPDYQGVFERRGIVSVQLPSTLQTIGNHAFSENAIDTLDLNVCTGLTSIGSYAFYENRIDSLLVNECSNLGIIDEYAFYQNRLKYLNLSNCTSLTTIDRRSFAINDLLNIDFTNCSALNRIGIDAFGSNELTMIDFSPCTSLESISNTAFEWNALDTVILDPCISLTYIGARAFANNQTSSFILPTPNVPGYGLEQWTDGNSDTHEGGSVATDLSIYYSADLVIVYSVEFTITDGSNPIEGAEVTLTGYNPVTTNVAGVAVVEKVFSETDISYLVAHDTYDEETGTVTVVASNITEDVIMNLSTYDVSFTITDGTTPINGASVTFGTYGSQITNGTGEVTFTNVLPEPDIAYTVTSDGYYEINETLTVNDDDVLEEITMELITYNVTFTVTNGTDPIEGASVNLTGYIGQLTNATGVSTIAGVAPETDIEYSVTLLGYGTETGMVTVLNSDINEDVQMELVVFDVSFTVTNGTSPIGGATVTLTGYGNGTTDAAGFVEFNNVVPAADIAYSVLATGYTDYSGTLTVSDAAVNEDVMLTTSTNALTGYTNIGLKVYPNPASNAIEVELDQKGVIQLVDAMGRVMLVKKLNAGNNRIAIDLFESGNYFIHVQIKETTIVKSLIIR